MTDNTIAITTAEAKQVTKDQCRNCQTELTGPFCHQCGQPDKSIIRFFGSLIKELLDDIISLDSRAFNTLLALFFRPGFLTNQYISGKRFSYVPPLRLYLITSLFCIFVFWLLNFTSDSPNINIEDSGSQVAENLTEEQLQVIKDKTHWKKFTNNQNWQDLNEAEKQESLAKINEANKTLATLGLPIIEVPSLEETNPIRQDKTSQSTQQSAQTQTRKPTFAEELSAELDNELAQEFGSKNNTTTGADTKEEQTGLNFSDSKVTSNFSWLSESENKALAEKLEKTLKTINEEPQDFISDMLEMLPKSMLLLVPLFALLMRLSYPFANRYYIEHLILALHGHAFLFLSVVMAVLIELISDSWKSSEIGIISVLGSILYWIEVAILIWIPIYFFLALKRVFQQKGFLTFFKWVWLGMLYLLLASAAIAGTFVVGVLLA